MAVSTRITQLYAIEKNIQDSPIVWNLQLLFIYHISGDYNSKDYNDISIFSGSHSDTTLQRAKIELSNSGIAIFLPSLVWQTQTGRQ